MESVVNHLKKKYFTRTVLLIIFGLGINLILSSFARLFNYTYLPLYFDSLGTVLATLPGVIVGFLTNAVNSLFTSGSTIFYGAISVILALLTRYFFINGFFRTFKKRVFSTVITAVICASLGGAITWVVYGFNFGAEITAPLAQKIALDLKMYPVTSQFASELLINLIDKSLMFAIAQLIFRFCPKVVKEIYQTAEPAQKKERLGKQIKSFFHSLLGSVVKMMILFVVVLYIAVMSISYYMYRNSNIEKYATICEDATSVSSLYIDPERIDYYIDERIRVLDEFVEEYLPEECRYNPLHFPEYFENYREYAVAHYSDEYLEAENNLRKVFGSFEGLEYLYVYDIRADGCHVVFDVDEEARETYIPFDESFTEQVPALLNGEKIEPIITDDTYGWLLTFYNPITDSNGKCVAYVCADVSMDNLRVDQMIYIVKISTILFSATIIVLTFILELFNKTLVIPINTLSAATSEFAYDEKADEGGTELIMNLEVNSCNEIEELYDSIKKLATDLTHHIEQIKSDAEEMNLMQEGIIIDFANMVENRDKNTGDHIKKTSLHQNNVGGVYCDVRSCPDCDSQVCAGQ